MEARPPNIEGRGEVTIRDLVKNCLRMRPDRIVVGECRAGEALDMLQAMNTGHDGSLTTVHANSPRDTLARLETLVLMAGFDLPVRAIREQMASAIDLIVQLTRLRDGTRRITHITEVQGMEGDVITLQDIFLFDFGMGVDEHGRFRGHLKATGVRPKFAEKLADLGIRLGPEVFQPEGFARRGGRGLMTRRARCRAGRRRRLVAVARRLFVARRRPASAQAPTARPTLQRPPGRRHRPDGRRRRRSSAPAAADAGELDGHDRTASRSRRRPVAAARRRPASTRRRRRVRHLRRRWTTTACARQAQGRLDQLARRRRRRRRRLGVVDRRRRRSSVGPALTTDQRQLLDGHRRRSRPADGEHARCGTASRQAATLFDDDADELQPNIVLITDGADDVVGGTTAADQALAVAGLGAARRSPCLDAARRDADADRSRSSTDAGGSYQDGTPTPSATCVERRSADHDRRPAVRGRPTRSGRASRRRRRPRARPSATASTSTARYVLGAPSRRAPARSTPVVAAGSRPASRFLHERPRPGRSSCCSALVAAGLARLRHRRSLVAKDDSLDNVLQPYADGYGRRTSDDEDDERAAPRRALIQRAVELTEHFAERQGFLEPGRGRARAGQPAAAGRRGAVLLRRRRASSLTHRSAWCSRRPRSSA